jgi:hypothetical protein
MFTYPMFSYKTYSEKIYSFENKAITGYFDGINAWELLEETPGGYSAELILRDTEEIISTPRIYARNVNKDLKKIAYLKDEQLVIQDTTSLDILELPSTKGTIDLHTAYRAMGWKDDNTLYYSCNLHNVVKNHSNEVLFCIIDLDDKIPRVTNEIFEYDQWRKINEDLSPPEECLESSHYREAVSYDGEKCVYHKVYAFIPYADAALFGWADYYYWDEDKGTKLLSRSVSWITEGRKNFYFTESGDLYMSISIPSITTFEGRTKSTQDFYKLEF